MYEVNFFSMGIDKENYISKMKIQVNILVKTQGLIAYKTPNYEFLNPALNTSLMLLTNTILYLEGNNPKYKIFNEEFFQHMQAVMHRIFLGDIHTVTEQGLKEIVDKFGFELTVSKSVKAGHIIEKLKSKFPHVDLSQEISDIKDLAGKFPTFNDYLESVLRNIPDLKRSYVKQARKYFNALNVLRNKVSHSDIQLSESEKITLKAGGFSKAISLNDELLMTFEGYNPIFLDLIRFFDNVYSRI